MLHTGEIDRLVERGTGGLGQEIGQILAENDLLAATVPVHAVRETEPALETAPAGRDSVCPGGRLFELINF